MRELVKQPNGLYAVFSSIVDDFIWANVTIEEIIEMKIEEAKERIRKETLDEATEIGDSTKLFYENYKHLIRVHGKNSENAKWIKENVIDNVKENLLWHY